MACEHVRTKLWPFVLVIPCNVPRSLLSSADLTGLHHLKGWKGGEAEEEDCLFCLFLRPSLVTLVPAFCSRFAGLCRGPLHARTHARVRVDLISSLSLSLFRDPLYLIGRYMRKERERTMQ